eukprot:CAMPEP_0195589772 /NCGR_PEP_ID=MMETSP0814-20130614/33804_1 /TAXON_ID=97485 /ORGANISM="Prymnesium parvum, Strain Texoma1" /LENGTH=88 /DNA_ID=CAMNT_0040728801 /DNA_START=809 /DNA_END=1072 /DNA_ORIENTATION=+
MSAAAYTHATSLPAHKLTHSLPHGGVSYPSSGRFHPSRRVCIRRAPAAAEPGVSCGFAICFHPIKVAATPLAARHGASVALVHPLWFW